MTARQTAILEIARIAADRHPAEAIFDQHIVAIANETKHGLRQDARFITDALKAAQHLRFERVTGTFVNLTIPEA